MSQNIFQDIHDIEGKGDEFVLCIIVQSHGSTPRKTGSKMLVKKNGDILGSIGGGEIEKRVIDEAQNALQDHQTRMIHYQLNDPQKGDPGICGGEMDVYIEPNFPSEKIIIIGAGHVGKAVAHLAKWLGLITILVDDRMEYIAQEENKDFDQCWCGPLTEINQNIRIDQNSYLVLTTRSSDLDMQILPIILNTPHKYLGVIGSKRRWETTRGFLIEKGFTEEQLKKIHSPIGLKIGAETPEEIAVSILAEIIQIKAIPKK